MTLRRANERCLARISKPFENVKDSSVYGLPVCEPSIEVALRDRKFMLTNGPVAVSPRRY